MNWRAGVLALLGALLLGVATPSAAFDTESMPTPEMQRRYDGLTHELRCMQCQNQSIADSPVGLAEDLRRDVREQIIAGKTDAEIREALAEPLKTILRAIRETLDQIPPELSSDIYDRGVALCGGGSLLRNLDKRIRDETQLPVQMVDDPLSCVVVGAGKMLSDDTLLKKLSVQ